VPESSSDKKAETASSDSTVKSSDSVKRASQSCSLPSSASKRSAVLLSFDEVVAKKSKTGMALLSTASVFYLWMFINLTSVKITVEYTNF